jgi:hypothetical protein
MESTLARSMCKLNAINSTTILGRALVTHLVSCSKYFWCGWKVPLYEYPLPRDPADVLLSSASIFHSKASTQPLARSSPAGNWLSLSPGEERLEQVIPPKGFQIRKRPAVLPLAAFASVAATCQSAGFRIEL